MEKIKMAFATGSIKKVQIADDGWSAWVTVAGLGKENQTVNYSLFSGGTPNLILSVREFSGETRDVSATTIIRKSFPEQSQLDHKIIGNDLLVHVSLSEYVFSTSTATVSARPGWATASIDGVIAGTLGVSSLAIDNSSSISAVRADPIANFVTPDRQIVSDKIHVEVVAGSLFAEKGDEIAFVRFIASDRHGNDVIFDVGTPSLSSWGKGDARPVYSYQADISTKGLVEGDLITVRAEVRDHIGNVVASAPKGSIPGDPAAFMDQVYLLDRDGSFGHAYAYVDASVASGSGKVSADAAMAASAPFKTIAAAMIATQTFNQQAFGRANIDNAEIRLKAGTHTWVGGPLSGTNAVSKDVWATITRDPAAAKDAVRITGATDGKNAFAGADYIKVEDLTIDRTPMGTSAAAIIRGQGSDSLWLHNVVFEGNNRSTASFVLPDVWVTQSELNGTGRALSTFGNNLNMFRIRGIDADSAGGNIVNGHLLVGSILDNLAIRYPNTAAMPNADGSIVAFNDVKSSISTTLFAAGGSFAINDIAVLNNRFVTINGPSPAISISADGQKFDISNIVFHDNVVVGQRVNIGYNDVYGAHNDKELVSLKWNDLYQLNTKHDVFSKDSDNTGAWSILYGVGFESNYINNKPAGQQISFGLAFDGMGSSGPGVVLQTIQSDAPDLVNMALQPKVADIAPVGTDDGQFAVPVSQSALSTKIEPNDKSLSAHQAEAPSNLDHSNTRDVGPRTGTNAIDTKLVELSPVTEVIVKNAVPNSDNPPIGLRAITVSELAGALAGSSTGNDNIHQLVGEDRLDVQGVASKALPAFGLSLLEENSLMFQILPTDKSGFGHELEPQKMLHDGTGGVAISLYDLLQQSLTSDSVAEILISKGEGIVSASRAAASVFESTDLTGFSENAMPKFGALTGESPLMSSQQAYEPQFITHI